MVFKLDKMGGFVLAAFFPQLSAYLFFIEKWFFGGVLFVFSVFFLLKFKFIKQYHLSWIKFLMPSIFGLLFGVICYLYPSHRILFSMAWLIITITILFPDALRLDKSCE